MSERIVAPITFKPVNIAAPITERVSPIQAPVHAGSQVPQAIADFVSGKVIESTYEELFGVGGLVETETLKPGRSYSFSYIARFHIPGANEPELFESTPETLIAVAQSKSKFYPNVSSVEFPDDIITYTHKNDIFYDGQSQTGSILWREYPARLIKGDFDWRHLVVKVDAVNQPVFPAMPSVPDAEALFDWASITMLTHRNGQDGQWDWPTVCFLDGAYKVYLDWGNDEAVFRKHVTNMYLGTCTPVNMDCRINAVHIASNCGPQNATGSLTDCYFFGRVESIEGDWEQVVVLKDLPAMIGNVRNKVLPLEDIIVSSYTEIFHPVDGFAVKGELVPGQVYSWDYTARFYIPGSSQVLHEATPETLIGIAISATEMSTDVRSSQYPLDIIKYTPNNIFDDGQSQTGSILWREHSLRGVAADFDWRNLIVRCHQRVESGLYSSPNDAGFGYADFPVFADIRDMTWDEDVDFASVTLLTHKNSDYGTRSWPQVCFQAGIYKVYMDWGNDTAIFCGPVLDSHFGTCHQICVEGGVRNYFSAPKMGPTYVTGGLNGVSFLGSVGTIDGSLTSCCILPEYADDITGDFIGVTFANQFLFRINGVGPEVEGSAYWDEGDHTLSLVTGLGNIVQVGQEMFGIGVNKTFTEVTAYNGAIVFANGVQGQRMSFDFADASDINKCSMIGVVTSSEIPLNDEGPVTTFGMVRGIDTSAWIEGTKLYLADEAPGTFTDIPPTYPNHVVWVATVVYQHAVNGVIFVNPLHDFHEWFDLIQSRETNLESKIGTGETTEASLKNYVEGCMEVSSSAGVLTLDLSQPVSHYYVNLVENITSVVLTNVPATGKVIGRTLETIQHASAVKTFAWGAGWAYNNSAAPTVTATVSKRDFFQIFTRDGGTVKIAGRGWYNVG